MAAKKASGKKAQKTITPRQYVIAVLRARENLPARERQLLGRVPAPERERAQRMLDAVDGAEAI